MLEALIRSVLIGAAATVLFDVYVRLVTAAGLPGSNWTLAGRWFAHIPRGTVRHASIAASPSIAGETTVGWFMHYATGVVFAAVLIALWGLDWARAPTPGPALIVGLSTVLLGWCVMSPSMGNGIAASHRPNRWTIRAVQLTGHLVFGLGMWAAAAVLSRAW